ncbi:hypothetical protein FFH90_012725 [Pseudomonas sp. ATCC 43928]|nr:hypothetical protein FFH90_012725 [Pseudomonas sp. ATCC 43928]
MGRQRLFAGKPRSYRSCNFVDNHTPVGARLARESVSPIAKNLNTETKITKITSQTNNLLIFQ